MIHEIVASNPDLDIRIYYSHDLGSYVPPHWHESLELVYILDGSISVTTAHGTETISKDNVSLVDSRMVHSVKTGGNRAIVLQIPFPFLEKYLQNLGEISFGFEHLSIEDKKDVNAYLCTAINDLYQSYSKKEYGYKLFFESKLLELIYTLLKRCSSSISDINTEKRSLKKVELIIRYIKANYQEKCTLPQIASVVGSNPDYLSRIFKKAVGMTIIDYLYRIRILNVYKDLFRTDLQISQIFAKNGCTNLKLSMRIFKEIYGITPKKARAKSITENGVALKNRINSKKS